MSSSQPTFDFESLFDADDYLYFYEETLRLEDTQAQVAFLERELPLTEPVRILDLGCGHGRHANELAARGHAVVGVDIVQGFIDAAVGEARTRGLSVQYVRGDYRELPWEGEFDQAVCLFNSFGFFRDEENVAGLRAIARALKAGGRFCLDIQNRDWMIRNLLPTAVLEKGNDLMIDRHQFDALTGRLADQRITVRGGVVKHLPFSIRLYSYSEICALLDSAGLRVVTAYGDWKGAPISMQQNRMVIVSEKAR